MDVSTIHEEIDFRYAGGVHIAPIFSHFEGEMLGSHWHEELELVYTVYGCNRHIINGEIYPVSPGQLIVVNSGFVHSVIPQAVPEEDASLKALVILISKDFLDIAFPQYEEVYFTNENRTTSAQMDRLILELLLHSDRLVSPAGIGPARNPVDGRPHAYTSSMRSGDRPQEDAALFPNSSGEMLHRNALVMELLSLLSQSRTILRREAGITGHMKSVEMIKQMILYVEQHYAEHLTRQDMADAFYISPNYFSTYFRQYVGITFSQYLKEYRLSRALELLLTTDDSVGRIAEEVGFSDDQSLIVAFRNKFHTTPLQYRKQHLRPSI